MSANIEKDGSFKLNTLHEQQNMAGGVEGPCSAMVTVFRPGNPIPLIIDVKRTFEVQPGKENVFAIKLKI
ncbi:MAG: hypothetical protein MK171_07350 [Pirellulales bacterium]|nr:hypothetical protein [Pirellulales bacterium]